MLLVSALDYVAYLQRAAGGEDQHEFWTVDNEPDYAAARAFALSIRERLGDMLDVVVSVEQRCHRVAVRVLIDEDIVTEVAA